MNDFQDNLWRDLVRDHGHELRDPDGNPGSRAGVLRRPRILAGSTLAVAAVAAGVVLAIGGSATTSSAFAVTKANDGSVHVSLNQTSALPQVNQKLRQMGTDEQIMIVEAKGPAPRAGAVTCTRAAGNTGPTVKVTEGTNGTETIGSGNTGAGTWHLGSCVAANGTDGTGNTGFQTTAAN